MKTIYFTVTNDLSFDQRMNRICGSLARHGYDVVLVGRRMRRSPPVATTTYRQKRISCFFSSGKMFYLEYNLRLLLFLLVRKMDAICAIDLDTILPVYVASRIKKIKRVYDAHELFTELKEVITRPGIRRAWTRVERFAVPRFPLGYTVSDGLAGVFADRYGVHYRTIRNLPISYTPDPGIPREQYILYQGAVNEARGFEFLVPAMQEVDCKLVVCGDGNFMPQLKALVGRYGLEDKVELRGMVPRDELRRVAAGAWLGLALAEKEGLNQYYALPNKFFDYIQAGLPQVTMDFPEYRSINEQYRVALLISNLEPKTIGDAINNLLDNPVLHKELCHNCLTAARLLNWEHEEEKLIAFYTNEVFALE